MSIKSQYAELLNSLDEMQQSPAYAVRRKVLEQAENTILSLEKDRAELAALLVKGRDLMVESIAIQNNTAEQRAKLLEIVKLQLAEAERVEAIMLREAGIGVTDRIKTEKARALIAEIEATQ